MLGQGSWAVSDVLCEGDGLLWKTENQWLLCIPQAVLLSLRLDDSLYQTRQDVGDVAVDDDVGSCVERGWL